MQLNTYSKEYEMNVLFKLKSKNFLSTPVSYPFFETTYCQKLLSSEVNGSTGRCEP